MQVQKKWIGWKCEMSLLFSVNMLGWLPVIILAYPATGNTMSSVSQGLTNCVGRKQRIFFKKK